MSGEINNPLFSTAKSRHLICFAQTIHQIGYNTGLAIINHGLFSQAQIGDVVATILTFLFYPQLPTPSASKSPVFEYTTDPVSPGTGLDAKGKLLPGGTYTVLLSQLLSASGAPIDFAGFIVLISDSPTVHCHAVISNFTSFTTSPEVIAF